MRHFTHNRRTSMTTIRSALLTAALFAGSAAIAAPVKYEIDPTHFYVQIGVFPTLVTAPSPASSKT